MEPFEDALGPVVRTDDDAPLPVTGMGPIVTALDELPAVALDGVVLANELLDNLPFRIVERTADGWAEVLVALDGDQLVETVVPALAELAAEADAVAADAAVPVGTRLPVPTRITDWLHSCAIALRHGVLVVVDYVASGAELVERGPDGWLRTYRGHGRGGPPLVAPGDQDITVDVPAEYLVHAASRAGFQLTAAITQAEWLLVARHRSARRPMPARDVGGPGPRRRPRGRPPAQPRQRGRRPRRPRRPRRAPGARLHPLTVGACVRSLG